MTWLARFVPSIVCHPSRHPLSRPVLAAVMTWLAWFGWAYLTRGEEMLDLTRQRAQTSFERTEEFLAAFYQACRFGCVVVGRSVGWSSDVGPPFGAQIAAAARCHSCWPFSPLLLPSLMVQVVVV